MHGPPTSNFAPTEVRAAGEPTEPPPPSIRWLACLVHRAQRLARGFAFGLRSKIRVYRGLFSGPTQLLHTCPMQAVAPHAAHYQRLCGCRLGQHSAALIKVSRWLGFSACRAGFESRSGVLASHNTNRQPTITGELVDLEPVPRDLLRRRMFDHRDGPLGRRVAELAVRPQPAAAQATSKRRIGPSVAERGDPVEQRPQMRVLRQPRRQ
jgi:hypothetical protein